jgi:hypothetical protein
MLLFDIEEVSLPKKLCYTWIIRCRIESPYILAIRTRFVQPGKIEIGSNERAVWESPMLLFRLHQLRFFPLRFATAAHSGNDLDIRGSHKIKKPLHVFWSFNIVHNTTSEIENFLKFRTCARSLL